MSVSGYHLVLLSEVLHPGVDRNISSSTKNEVDNNIQGGIEVVAGDE